LPPVDGGRRYAAVITDLIMPGMDGFEIVEALRTVDSRS
jgi:CheY-like chemotaxis protein